MGGTDIFTVNIEELNGKTLQADYVQKISYDFSETIDSSQIIKRMVLSMSGSFKPGIGYYEVDDGTIKYGPLPGCSSIEIWRFDNFLPYEYQFLDEALAFDFKIDSDEIIGLIHCEYETPYAGYSGDKAGEFEFSFDQPRGLSTIIETWPEIAIANATMTLYVIPEPATIALFVCGGFILRKKL
jgi:hypothetical protein